MCGPSNDGGHVSEGLYSRIFSPTLCTLTPCHVALGVLATFQPPSATTRVKFASPPLGTRLLVNQIKGCRKWATHSLAVWLICFILGGNGWAKFISRPRAVPVRRNAIKERRRVCPYVGDRVIWKLFLVMMSLRLSFWGLTTFKCHHILDIIPLIRSGWKIVLGPAP